MNTIDAINVIQTSLNEKDNLITRMSDKNSQLIKVIATIRTNLERAIKGHTPLNQAVYDAVDRIGFGRTLQCLIEIVDDSINKHNTSPVWKLTLAEHLENAYDAYMNKGQDSLCGINND